MSSPRSPGAVPTRHRCWSAAISTAGISAPERWTMRLVWFGAEEVGLFGGLDYRARHGKEPHHGIAESDFGAGRVWKVDSRLGKDREAEAKMLQRALGPLGIVPGALDQASGSDIS